MFCFSQAAKGMHFLRCGSLTFFFFFFFGSWKIPKKKRNYLGQCSTLVQNRSLSSKILFWGDTLQSIFNFTFSTGFVQFIPIVQLVRDTNRVNEFSALQQYDTKAACTIFYE